MPEDEKYGSMPFKNNQAAKADKGLYDRLTSARNSYADSMKGSKKTPEQRKADYAHLSKLDQARQNADPNRFSVDTARANAKKNMIETTVGGKKTSIPVIKGDHDAFKRSN